MWGIKKDEKPGQLARGLWRLFGSAERNVAMAKKAEDERRYKHDCAGKVRGGSRIAGLMANEWDQNRKRGCRKQDAGRVDADAADPFFDIVPVRFENKPLVSQKCEGDRKQI